MKRYKLLKDLPTFKAGQLAYISKTGNLIAGTPENQKTTETGLIIMIYHETTLKKFPNILTEWFEEIQESTDSIHWKPKKATGWSIMTMDLKRSPCVNLITMMMEKSYVTKPEQKLKNPSKKTSKIGRFILELRRKNNATRSDSRLDWCDNTYWNCRLAHSVRNCDYCNYYKNTECINTINQ